VQRVLPYATGRKPPVAEGAAAHARTEARDSRWKHTFVMDI
jgi:hypothetical protein